MSKKTKTGSYGPVVTDPHAFVFDLDRAIREQAVERLEQSPLLPFDKGVGPTASGVYVLYYKKKLVYVGKSSKGTTKSKRTLRARLNEHYGKLSKVHIDMGKIECRYMTFESEWWVFAAEFALITYYDPEWNGSGYGSKVPGKGRPGTGKVPRFYQMFPMKSWTQTEELPDVPDESHT